jgi:hypothetical protein
LGTKFKDTTEMYEMMVQNFTSFGVPTKKMEEVKEQNNEYEICKK